MTTIDSIGAAAAADRTVPVWDPLLRLFHWSLVLSFLIAFISAEELELVHETAGYLMLGLLGFRLLWGLVGPPHARFDDFVPTPLRLRAYLAAALRGRPPRHLGHNPAGGVMILLLLAGIATCAGSGIAVTLVGTEGEDGPLAALHEVTANGLLALVVAHVVGVVIMSLRHRENLALAMITGRKRTPELGAV